MPNKKGQIQKGEHLSKKTEFKKGEHWRDEKPFWNSEWLFDEYVNKKRSAADIASQFGITETAILFWLKKHNIPRRSMQEIRSQKHWGLSGETNGMYGRTGISNPRWRGGVSPERQALYSSQEWAKAVRIVWKRDKRVCQRCGNVWNSVNGLVMHIHHIVSFAIKEKRTDPNNLILLCEGCHRWVHSKQNTNGDFIKEA